MNTFARSFLLSFLCIMILGRCGIFEPIQEAAYRDQGSRIRSKDAKLLIATEFAALLQRCPSDQSSIVAYLDILLNASTCSSTFSQENGSPKHENHHPDFFTGCADARYISRNEIDACLYTIRLLPCNSVAYIFTRCMYAFGPPTLNRLAN